LKKYGIKSLIFNNIQESGIRELEKESILIYFNKINDFHERKNNTKIIFELKNLVWMICSLNGYTAFQYCLDFK